MGFYSLRKMSVPYRIFVRSKSTLSEEKRFFLAEGPGLGAFLSRHVERTAPTVPETLRRQKGQK